MTCFRGRSHQWRDFSSFVSCCRVKPAKEAILEKKPNHRRRNFLSHLQLKDYFNGTLQGSFDQSNSSTGLTTWPEEPTSMTIELCRGMVISCCWSTLYDSSIKIKDLRIGSASFFRIHQLIRIACTNNSVSNNSPISLGCRTLDEFNGSAVPGDRRISQWELVISAAWARPTRGGA